MAEDKKILRIEDLSVEIAGRQVIDGVSLGVDKGEVLAIVGESGSGKTLTGLAIMDLLPDSAVRRSGRVFFRDDDIFSMGNKAKRKIRGKDIAMVFQEPFTAMNPVMKVGHQIGEVIDAHFRVAKEQKKARVEELLGTVKLSVDVMDSYPHELSGGMRQRAIIAMALACGPEVLILDEPTTALDVSIQKEVIDLIRNLQKERDFAAFFITHDFSVVNLVADTVAVMRYGKIIEYGVKENVLRNPKERYTRHLIDCVPRMGDKRKRLGADV